MYFSKTIWLLTRQAYLYQKISKQKFVFASREVSSTIPRFFKDYVILKASSLEGEAKFRVVHYQLCGYPLHKFGFWHRSNWKSYYKKKISKPKGFKSSKKKK